MEANTLPQLMPVQNTVLYLANINFRVTYLRDVLIPLLVGEAQGEP